MNNLQRLELAFRPGDGESIMFVVSFAKACPHLHTLVLKLRHHGARNACNELTRNMTSSAERDTEQSFPRLKLVGFDGLKLDLVLAAYILQNATGLEKTAILIHKFLEILRFFHPQSKRVLEARERAKMLQTRHPLGAKLGTLSEQN